MNTKLIKSEIDKLAQIVASWDGAQVIDAIERDLALDKIKHLYELIRFGEEQTVTATEESVAAVVASAIADVAEQNDEKDIEVEFLFDEEDELKITSDDSELSEDDDVEVEVLFAEEDDEEETEEAVETDEVVEAVGPVIVSEPEPIVTAEPEPQPIPEPEPVAVPEPEPVVIPEPEPIAEPEPKPAPATEKSAKPTSSNLFGIEEVRRPRTSKHQRMMSIYNDAATEKSREKAVDISKIFDFGLDSDTPAPKVENSTYNVVQSDSNTEPAEKSVTLGDVMAQNSQTLADTIVTPAPLAEEITNSKIASLRHGVGLNDKFLMIRDLFDGDNEAYDQAISDLDSMETFDDCIIYIAENFEWNPDSEGAKFIMQLLERKHS